MNIKEQFPDETTLEAHVRTKAPEFLATLSQQLGEQEDEYIASLSARNIGRGAVVIGFVFLYAAYLIIESLSEQIITFSYPLALVTGVLCALGIFFLRVGYTKISTAKKIIKKFNNGLNALLFPLVFSIFNINANWIPHTPHKPADSKQNTSWTKNLLANFQLYAEKYSAEHRQVVSLLDHSELITEPRNTIKIDDMVDAKVQNRSLFLSELDAKHETGSGRNRRVKRIFRGYFVSFDVSRTLTGKTFVSTAGDRLGFGNQTILGNLQGNDVQRTRLEWNEFERLLRVTTSDPTEARYILTPDFMSDLYDWWEPKKINIRIAFKDRRMYMLYPDTNIRFGSTVRNLTEAELCTYLLSIATPLLHVLHLVEDVENRLG